jgi:membrane fusion protein (multidrug efflux system)
MSASRIPLPSLRAARPWIAAVVGLLLLAGVGFAVHRSRIAVRTDDAYVEGTMTYLGARVSGQVIQVDVDEHQRVKKGQVLVVLDPSDYQARVDRARADVDAAQNRMAAARASAAASDASKGAAEADLWKAERELKRIQALVERGAASRQQLDGATAARESAQGRVLSLALQAEAARADVANEAPLKQARSALQEAELNLAHTRITAPFDGVIGRKNVEPGAIVSPGQPLLSITGDGPGWVMANFKETQLRRIRLGNPTDVWIDAFPGVVWKGHVDSFSPATGAQYALIPPDPAAGNFTKVVQRVPVKIVLDHAEGDGSAHLPDPLPIGLSAEVSVGIR